MKKKAQDLKKGNKVSMGEETIVIEEIEMSDLGKHGTKKCRIVGKKENNEKVVIIRPADYPFNCLN